MNSTNDDDEGKPLTMFLCMPKCEHVYDQWEDLLDESGRVCGGTQVCSKCGTSAMQESLWNGP